MVSVQQVERQALIVVGMHRSGTSALAGVLVQLGAAAPKTLMKPNAHNERGYWESQAFCDFNDRLLRAAGLEWWSTAAIPNAFFAQAQERFGREFRALLGEEYGDARLLCIKDPRLCRLLPFWLPQLEACGIAAMAVLPVRHPMNVARSLEVRDRFTVEHSLRLWLCHNLEAETHTRGIARVFAHYDELLTNWRTLAKKIARRTGHKWPRRELEAGTAIDAFLEPALRHHASDAAPLEAAVPLDQWLRVAYDRLRALAMDRGSRAAMKALDRIRDEFDQSALALDDTGLHRPWVPDATRTREIERSLPLQVEVERLHRYALACRFADGKEVLDIACGEGYGSALLAAHAIRVLGVDISEQAIAHARATYPDPRIRFALGSCTKLPCEDRSIDVVVSFETIEHIAEHDEFMKEIKRVLRPQGLLILSSPDKRNYSDATGLKNEFHVRELYEQELTELLQGHFAAVALYGQRILHGSVIAPHLTSTDTAFHYARGDAGKMEHREAILDPLYLIAFATDAALPAIPASVFDGTEPFAKDLVEKARKGYRRIQTYPYRLGLPIDCRPGGNGPLYLTAGWAPASASGTWSVGEQSQICFQPLVGEDKSDRVLELAYRPFAVPGTHICRLEVALNGKTVDRTEHVDKALVKRAITLDGPLFRQHRAVTLTFRFPGAKSPSELGMSTDVRKLGIWLEELTVR